MAASYGSGLQSPPPIGRPVDRVFEEAQFTGEIYLNGRKLRDYPKLCSKYDLSDTILVDISRNRLTELPHEVCEYLFVERINCYHNVIRSIPDAISQLQTLTHLNLSRNQLTVLPTALCLLSALEVLSASNNKLVSLPEEIGKLENLMDLDVSCNEISHLPLQIGDLVSLRCLNLRRNFLVELPFEISRLQLFRLDFSSNRIERIPTVFRKMETLEQFILDHNPLSSPPAYICTKGRQHIMKYLHTEAIKEDRKRGIIMNSDNDMKRFSRKSLPPQQSSEEFRTMLGAPESKWKRHTVLSNDSGYSTCDGAERNGWQSGEELKRQKAEYERKKKHAEQVRVKHLEEEEEREKEERRRAALKLLEEQKLLKERMEEQRRQEEALLQEERLRLEEENRRREEEEEAARQGELLRLQESVRNQNTEDNKLRQLNEIQKPTESKPADRNKITNKRNVSKFGYYSYTQPNSHPRPPPTHSSSLHQPPQPPTSLPLHGLSAPLSPSQTSSSTYPMPQQTQHQRTDSNYILTENEYRNALSSQSFKEQRRLATSNQYRRAASDTLKKPGQPSPNSQHVDTLNYINRNGVSENSRQSSTSTTPSVSPSPSPRNSVSQLAKPTSPSGSMSQLAKPSSPMGSMSQLAKPTGNKSSVPRANGPATAGQNQAVRRTKIAGDSSNASSPTTARSARTAGSSNLRPQGTTTLNPAASNIRRSSNSSTTDDDSKPKKGPTTPTTETSRIKSRLEEPKQRGSIPNTALKKPGVPESVDTNRRIQTRPPTNNFGSGRGRVGPKTIEDPGVVRRREEMHREEAEQMDRLRQTIETRLRVTLPDNLAEALRDGVVLCHLANQIRPRSVGSIHVPSPAVPKLTLAKCRRNVDNFLDACKKIGVDQEQICVPHDIFDEKGISRVAITVAALVAIGTNPKQSAV
ncbi:leucine-rich repeat and calponin homology domain-containing protein 1-like isoform X8 [Physella acuta]|uniref:leucine-rich repeat and calponin homology domain-containing protein 1-like isoform X8 n=1 Tax=Physella acuta TaxID=109671 RepID=UPI0027DBCEC0|nr:leucine-rich repeat and calponin homology domain-containing protein 1-like isoform X8 [Physella acuta]